MRVSRFESVRLVAVLVGATVVAGCGSDPVTRNGSDKPAESGLELLGSSAVFAGIAGMLYDGPACTHEPGATEDRWCGFVGLTTEGQRNLFVVNVSQVAAGAAVTCGGSEPNCLLLTASLGTDGFDPSWRGTYFQGDTLVYYDETLTPYAWRPGMSSGRLLAVPSETQFVILCLPAAVGTGVACLSVSTQALSEPVIAAELLAGKVDGPAEPLLASVDSVIASNTADQGGPSRFSYGFPRITGNHLAWTTRETVDGPEVLKVQTVDDPASKLTVASDVHGWEVSADGARWFWRRGVDNSGSGLLQTAPFPSGTSPTDVLAGVVEYGLAPPQKKAVVARTSPSDVIAIADPSGAPDRQRLIDRSVQTLLSLSNGHIAYGKHFVGRSTVDLFISKLDGTATCTADTTVGVPESSIVFSSNGDAAIWALTTTSGFDGDYTRLADCSTEVIAPDIDALDWLGEQAVLFMDEFDLETFTGALRFRNVAPDRHLEPGPATLIAEHVDAYALVGPAPRALVYVVYGAGDADGVHVSWLGARR